ncbi:MAG: hypothetical protein AAFR17_16970, partial [Pseudomonadota bacterium]
MAKLKFKDFQELISEIRKENLFDAVKPSVQTYADIAFGNRGPETYKQIVDDAFCEAEGVDRPEKLEDYSMLISRMGKDISGKGNNYRADRAHAERLYYTFLFGNEHRESRYGDDISVRLFEESFFKKFERELQRKRVKPPRRIPPSPKAHLGPLTISLGLDPEAEPLTICELSDRDLLEDGKPSTYSALHWRADLSGIHGRDGDFERLREWAEDPDNTEAKVMLVSGPGGVGKSRLVADVLTKLDLDEKWSAGFLPPGDLTNLPAFGGTGNGVAVAIDYPEERTDQVVQILKNAAQEQTYDRPVRIILVSRETKKTWSERIGNLHPQRFEEILLEARPYLEKDDALQVISEVLDSYPRRISRPPSTVSGAEAWLDQDHVHRLPLNIVAASVHAVLDPEHAFALNSRDVLIALADIELTRVRHYSMRDLGSPEALKRLLALAILTPVGLTQTSLHELGEMGFCAGEKGDGLLDRVRRTPFWRNKTDELPDRLHRIVPDKAAAAFLVKAFDLVDKEPPLSLPKWMGPAAMQAGEGFSDILGRVALDAGAIDGAAGRLIEDLAIKMLGTHPALVMTLNKIAYRENSVFSSRFALAVSSNLLAEPRDEAEKARLLNNQSTMLSKLGRRKD